MKKVLTLIFLLISINIFSQENNKNILILHSYHNGFRWTDDIQKGISETFEKNNLDADLYLEYMDTKRIFNEQYLDDLKQMIIHKYSDTPIDLIITSDDNAYNLVKESYYDVFKGIPVVFCGVNNLRESDLEGFPLFKGVNEEADIKGNINLILSIHKDLKELVFITDKTTTGKKIRKEFEKYTYLYDDKIEFTILDNINSFDLKLKLSELSSDTVVLYSVFLRDSDGVFLEYDDSVELITDSSSVPVYGLWDFSLNYGITGGFLTSGYLQGLNAAEIALKVINGTQIESLNNVLESPEILMFDYKQLKKYHIGKNLLPDDSVIINKPYSISDYYLDNKVFVLTTSLVTISIILCMLFIHIHNIKKSKQKLSISQSKYKAIFENTGNATVIIEDNIIYNFVNSSANLICTFTTSFRHKNNKLIPSIPGCDIDIPNICFNNVC